MGFRSRFGKVGVFCVREILRRRDLGVTIRVVEGIRGLVFYRDLVKISGREEVIRWAF